ncbi:4'-phosphopantetheinyl transferase [Micromonospora parva]|uniref:4'-phosphopantetheinyl transferase n=1 Tax=Micromonospora parva TaxID=1464048 RepID=UPI0037983471
MIGAILPERVRHAEAFGDLPEASLHPTEEEAVAGAVESRRREFATVRACARKVLAELGGPPAPILPGPRGSPQWPAGFVGSMTHCDGYRAAALARAGDVLTIGVDAEPNRPLPEGILGAIALPREAESVQGLLRTVPEVHWDRLLFSAKESVYKAWFPLTGRFLEFEDVLIRLAGPRNGEAPGQGQFTAELAVAGPWPTGRAVRGRWIAGSGLICTSVVLANGNLEGDT